MIEAELLTPQVNTAGLIAHYKLQHGSMNADEVFDYSLNNHVGALTGTNIAPVYPGFSFNGTDDIITISAGPDSVKSALLWINLADISGTEIPFMMEGINGLSVDLGVLSTVGFAAGTTILYIDAVAAATAITASTWHLIGVTNTTGASGTTILIGKNPAPEFFLEGVIGEVMFFDRVLSATEVKSVYEVTRSTYGV